MYIRLYSPTRFDWDEHKGATTFAMRGFDFEFSTLVFDGPTAERIDDREDYDEVRIVAIGIAEGIHLTVVYTDRIDVGEVVRRIISARRSNSNERQAYQKTLQEAQPRPR